MFDKREVIATVLIGLGFFVLVLGAIFGGGLAIALGIIIMAIGFYYVATQYSNEHDKKMYIIAAVVIILTLAIGFSRGGGCSAGGGGVGGGVFSALPRERRVAACNHWRAFARHQRHTRVLCEEIHCF